MAPEPRARLRLSLSELLTLVGPLGESVDRLPSDQLDESVNAEYALYRRLTRVISGLVDGLDPSDLA